ncbi:MAG: hypothetical protein QM736_17005 [Vicinamibacterales bacterium]
MRVVCQPGESVQFHSFVPERFASAVRWSATGGTIGTSGLYVAPAEPGSYVVRASIGDGLDTNATVRVVPRQGQTTDTADQFVDSIGINVHLHYDDTVYRQNFALVRTRLVELGVRHVRDGMVDTTWQEYYDRHNELGRAGIKGIFIAAATAPESLLLEYPTRVADAFEGYDGPNEYDRSDNPQWSDTVRRLLERFQAVKHVPALAGFPVYGPSLTTEQAYDTLGDVSAAIDSGNMHNYFSSYNPGTGGWGDNGFGSIAWNLGVVRRSSGQKPIVSTETGYFTDPSMPDAVPDAVATEYMPRLLLEQFRQGIARTYIYELADERAQHNGLGLLTADGTPKGSFYAVAELMKLLANPGAAYDAAPLRYTVEGGTPELRALAFHKRNGHYYLLMWLETPGYDHASGRVLETPAQTVRVTIGSAVRHIATYRWQPDGHVAQIAGTGSLPAVTVTDTLQAFEFAP